MRVKVLLLTGILVLAGLAGCDGAITCSKVDQARSHIRSLEAALVAYWLDHARYPATLDELLDGYASRLPLDPWGNAYRYSVGPPPVAPGEAHFYIWSYGSDSVPGGHGENADIGTRIPGE